VNETRESSDDMSLIASKDSSFYRERMKTILSHRDSGHSTRDSNDQKGYVDHGDEDDVVNTMICLAI
jgi:hypothetical protein